MLKTTPSMNNLKNLTIVSFESRLSNELKTLIERQQAHAIHAPCLKEIPKDNPQEIFSFHTQLVQQKIDIIVFFTGVGCRYLMDQFKSLSLYESAISYLKKIPIIARGPKSIKALNEHQLPITLKVDEPNTWKEILDAIDHWNHFDIQGKTIAIQEYGQPNWNLIHELEKRKSHVYRIPIYEWTLPDDLKPVQNAIHQIINGNVDICLFTSAIQVQHLLMIATQMNLKDSFLKNINQTLIASVGPTCSESLINHAINPDFMPTRPKMGLLIRELADQATSLINEKKSRSVTYQYQYIIPNKTENTWQQLVIHSPFMQACRLEKPSQIPIWLMRQAGRYMKEYQTIRDQVSFLQLCKNPELCAEVTIMAQELLKVDAAIIFSDLLLIVEPMGLSLEYSQNGGPIIHDTVQSETQINKLISFDMKDALHFVFEAIRITRANLNPNIPLLGFTSAPFTLASYMIEGGSSKNYILTKSLMYQHSQLWHTLMEYITQNLIQYSNLQIQSGVQAIQIFDSWVGCLGPEDFQEFVAPYTQKLIQNILPGTPTINFGTGTGPFIDSFKKTGGSIIGLDYRVDLASTWDQIGHDVGIQGNLDPILLFASKELLKKRTRSLLNSINHQPGFIFNLGHGLLPKTPIENVRFLIDLVQSYPY